MRQSDDYSTDKVIIQYLKYGLEARVQAGHALDQNNNQEFKKWLNRLYREYFSKFQKRSDVERPEWAVTEMLGIKQPRSVDDMNMQQCRALYQVICDLQEKLEHTSIESADWENEEI